MRAGADLSLIVAASPFAGSSGAAHQPASLTEWLRSRSDAQLAELLRRRPDLALPAPHDLPNLASRLSVRTSVQRAVDGLDGFTLTILESLVLAASDGTVALDDATALLGTAEPVELQRGLDDLLALALVWGPPERLRLVNSVPEALGPYPGGLGRPAAQLLRQVADVQLAPVLREHGLPPMTQPRSGAAVAAVLADRARLDGLLAGVTPAERDVLDRLAAGPPVGIVRVSPGAEPPPAASLVQRGLLVPIDARTVELPREVGFALRPSPLGPLDVRPPDIAVVEREPDALDRLGTTAVLETLRLFDALADLWTFAPPAQLRSGGVGVRELRRTARELGADEATTALVAEVAMAAGLLNATHGLDPVYLPTAEFDTWRRHDSASRWVDLALAWLRMTRQPSLVGERDERDRLITALGPDAERGTVPALRAHVLDVLTTLRPGSAPTDREQVLRRLAWQSPRRASGQRPLAAAVLDEADRLGLTAAGGLTGYTRTLLAGNRTVVEQVLTAALPAPVDHFLVQPDLTVVVPGPPTPELAAELALAADLESTGGASVYRVTEQSVRRALDSGRSGADVAALFAQRSRTPVPQALRYLIDDLARRHGALRSGTAASYLRCEDEALLARVLADRGVGQLQLRRIAPTVVVSGAPVARVLDVLREAGFAPAAESADGEVVALGADVPRAPSRQPARAIRARAGADSDAAL
ncbi:MAG TPA: helicase-associated domain-containing protein, partial [Jatrophihabitantaceae bacterium]